MIRNSLPGEGGSSDWFHRLSKFEQQETVRQVEFKRSHWPDLPDGVWTKRPDRTYPHILPEGELAKALFPPIAQDVVDYCTSNDIAIHSEALNLRSSQMCCFNLLFPLREDLPLAARALEPVLPGATAVESIEFEFTGPDGATTWLGEPAGGKRGQNRTSIDAAVWWRTKNGRFLTLIEWKYTEKAFGTCGGHVSDGNKNKAVCDNLRVTGTDVASDCYLTHGKNTRRYWEHMEKAGIDLTAFSRLTGCPFKGPFYQLMRQFMLAAYLRLNGSVEEVFVACVDFRGNTSIHKVPLLLRPLGSEIVDAWNSCLAGVPELRRAYVEHIVDRLRDLDSHGKHDWLGYLAERYGL